MFQIMDEIIQVMLNMSSLSEADRTKLTGLRARIAQTMKEIEEHKASRAVYTPPGGSHSDEETSDNMPRPKL